MKKRGGIIMHTIGEGHEVYVEPIEDPVPKKVEKPVEEPKGEPVEVEG